MKPWQIAKFKCGWKKLYEGDQKGIVIEVGESCG